MALLAAQRIRKSPCTLPFLRRTIQTWLVRWRSPSAWAVVRGTLNRPLTLTEKILFTHLYHPESLREFKRGVDYIELRPDRAGTHDIGGPMAIIQFLSSGKERIALPAALVCDHLVQANVGAIPDLKVAEKGNVETYEFLRDVSRRYGFDFWPAGSGICHQVFMENYNFPGCMMLVTDSHTPTACGMGMLAIGVGGADLVDALMGMEWELKMPKIIGVKLTGQLQGWASAKDVILKLTGMLSTKGATNCVVEFFGEGAATLSASGKATIGNMGAEIFANGSMTRDQIADQFSMQDIKDGIRGVQNGLCDAFMPKTLPCLTALTEYSATLCRQAISSAASLREIALHSNSAAARRIATSTQYVTKTRATPVILLTQ